MGGLDRKVLADRAGVDAAYASRLAGLGLLRAGPGGGFAESDIRRVQLLQVLDRSGLSAPAAFAGLPLRTGRVLRRLRDGEDPGASGLVVL